MGNTIARPKYALHIPAVAWIMAFTMAFTVIVPIGAQLSERDIIEHRAGGIDVAVRFDNLDRFRAGKATTLEFTISMDTHVVNLFQFDLTEVTEIRVDGRVIDATSPRWVGESEDFHHRLGQLILAVPAELSGAPIAADIELRMLGVGTAVRSFTWES